MTDLEADTVGELTRGQQIWQEWRGFVIFIVLMLLFRSVVADWNHVPTGSMLPTILEGDRIVVNKLAYELRVPFTLIRISRWDDPERSDVITFESPQDAKMLVKRVIGIPGDVVQLVNNDLIINGERAKYKPVEIDQQVKDFLDETSPAPYGIRQETALGQTRTVMSFRLNNLRNKRSYGPITVPEGQYLVLGDNRDNSQDSRYIGLVDRDLILGRARHIAFSLNQENYYIPRGGRFFEALK